MSTPTKSQSTNEYEWEDPNFPFAVFEEQDGSFTMYWDEDHPVTSVFNTWTEDDFINMLMDACTRELENSDITE